MKFEKRADKECPYCNEIKKTVLWRETEEWVCFDCRLDFLERDFND